MEFCEEVITSRQNRRVVGLSKLTDRKEREERREFRFDGIKLCGEAIRHGCEIPAIYLRASDADRILGELRNRLSADSFSGVGTVFLLSDDVFDRISEEKSPEGIICVAKYIDKFEKIATIYNSGLFLPPEERIVLIESVRDPSNVGAILRSAAGMGIDRLILSEDCADIYHSKAVRASMGAVFHQRVDRVPELAPVIRSLQENGRRVFAAMLDPRAQKLGSFTPLAGDCVVIGNEGHGISDKTAGACFGSVIIPMADGTESFNAAVAASILMWEFSGRGR